MWAMAAGALISAGSACTKACKQVGYSSNVQVELPGAGWSVASLCLDGACGANPVIVDDSPATYRYELTVASPTGEESIYKGELETKEFELNGKGCDPKTANAILRIEAGGNLEIAWPGQA